MWGCSRPWTTKHRCGCRQQLMAMAAANSGLKCLSSQKQQHSGFWQGWLLLLLLLLGRRTRPGDCSAAERDEKRMASEGMGKG